MRNKKTAKDAAEITAIENRLVFVTRRLLKLYQLYITANPTSIHETVSKIVIKIKTGETVK